MTENAVIPHSQTGRSTMRRVEQKTQRGTRVSQMLVVETWCRNCGLGERECRWLRGLEAPAKARPVVPWVVAP